MESILAFLHGLFKATPEIPLFLSLVLGYAVGSRHFGKFQLGGVAGSLLAAVLIGQVGVEVSPQLQTVLFTLFIYAVGYESGPQFFRSLNRKSLREIILAAFLAVSGLITVVVTARLFGFDKGLAAGIAAGGLTQSAIMGTAQDALASMGLAAEELARLNAGVGIGYAVTYVFGSFGAIIICMNVLPKLFDRDIREDALRAEAETNSVGLLNTNQEQAVSTFVGRIYKVGPAAGETIRDVEALSREYPVSVERVKRGRAIVPHGPDTTLQKGDLVLLAGRRAAVLELAGRIGKEVYGASGMDLRLQKLDVALTAPDLVDKTLKTIRDTRDPLNRHGVFLLAVYRDGSPLEVSMDLTLRKNDLLTLYGMEQDVKRVAATAGYVVPSSDKTDFIYMGLGLVVGLLIGLLVVHVGGIPITLGSGGGALLAGLLFGWARTRRRDIGNMPTGAVNLLKDLGLAGFVAVVGLNNGLKAVTTVMEQGVSIFLAGVVVTILPMLLTLFFGRWVLRYDNAAVLAGALSGSRSANPAFGEVLNKAENSVPTVPFAITYALANVFLTLLGPLVVALV